MTWHRTVVASLKPLCIADLTVRAWDHTKGLAAVTAASTGLDLPLDQLEAFFIGVDAVVIGGHLIETGLLIWEWAPATRHGIKKAAEWLWKCLFRAAM